MRCFYMFYNEPTVSVPTAFPPVDLGSPTRSTLASTSLPSAWEHNSAVDWGVVLEGAFCPNTPPISRVETKREEPADGPSRPSRSVPYEVRHRFGLILQQLLQGLHRLGGLLHGDL